MKVGASDYLAPTTEVFAQLDEIIRTITYDHATRRVAWQVNQAREIQDEFISSITHALRTPLTPLKGFIQLMARAIAQEDLPLDRPRFARNFAVIDKQINRFERLISLLLDARRIQIGDVPLWPEPIDLNQLATNVVARLQTRLTPENSQRLHLEITNPALVGFWDAERLAQVLTNLLENAIEYSPDGGPIVLPLWAEGEYARLSIRDEGIGILVDQQLAVFQPFVRGRNVPSPPFEGLGLGLAISREMVERHGGRIWVESRGVAGQGTPVQVRLPFSAGSTDQSTRK